MKSFKITLLIAFIAMYAYSQEKSFLKWQVGYHKKYADVPAKWLNSTVPGAVQLDVMSGENYKQPYWYGENWQQFTWMENFHFTYKSTFA